MHHILVVDDDPHIGRLLEAALSRHDCQVTVLQQPTEALTRIQQLPPDLLILDVLMPELTGFELLEKVRETATLKEVPVLFTTSSHDLKRLEQIFALGCDYLSKPIKINELVARVRFQLQLRQRTLTMQRQQAELDSLKAHLSTQVPRRPGAFAEVITNSPKMLSLFPYCEAVSQSPRPMLITGETGTGKELVARAIHQASGRTIRPGGGA